MTRLRSRYRYLSLDSLYQTSAFHDPWRGSEEHHGNNKALRRRSRRCLVLRRLEYTVSVHSVMTRPPPLKRVLAFLSESGKRSRIFAKNSVKRPLSLNSSPSA